MTIKICKQCSLEKKDFALSFNKDKSKSWERSICKDCQKQNKKIYSQNNRAKLNRKMSEYRKNNPDKIARYKRKYYESNREKVILSVKNYAMNNVDKINAYYKKYKTKNSLKISKRMKRYCILNKAKLCLKQKERYKNIPSIRIRQILSSKIRSVLINNGHKKTYSILKHLPYSMEDLRIHLESKFEPWMSWNNYGSYSFKSWNDNDLSTWRWNIDHIIPQSLFNYSSVEEQTFKDCWSLNNLRPYSAKQNLLDSNRKYKLSKV